MADYEEIAYFADAGAELFAPKPVSDLNSNTQKVQDKKEQIQQSDGEEFIEMDENEPTIPTHKGAFGNSSAA